MFVISIFVAILVTVIASSEAKIVPIKTNGSGRDDVSQVRIVGGKPAGLEQSQYQVALYFVPHKGSQSCFFCGGTLISDQYVLTASHCIVKQNKYKDSITVYLGARNPENPHEEGQERYNVTSENFIKPNDYNSGQLINDIALIKLPKKIKFNKYIKPARLPDRRRHTKEFLLGKTIISSGWGATKEVIEMPEQLLFMKTIAQPAKVCHQTYGSYDDNRMICINAKGKSTCYGDSGGPHIYKENGVNYVVGVTSFGSKSCVIGAPQVLTRVTHYLDWIAENTGLRV